MSTVPTMGTNEILPSAHSAPPAKPESPPVDRARPSLPARVVRGLAVDRIGAVYVLIAIAIVFTIWVPSTFPNLTTAKQIFNTQPVEKVDEYLRKRRQKALRKPVSS